MAIPKIDPGNKRQMGKSALFKKVSYDQLIEIVGKHPRCNIHGYEDHPSRQYVIYMTVIIDGRVNRFMASRPLTSAVAKYQGDTSTPPESRMSEQERIWEILDRPHCQSAVDAVMTDSLKDQGLTGLFQMLDKLTDDELKALSWRDPKDPHAQSRLAVNFDWHFCKRGQLGSDPEAVTTEEQLLIIHQFPKLIETLTPEQTDRYGDVLSEIYQVILKKYSNPNY